MKKIITAFSLTAMVGLGFLGYKNTPIDKLLDTEDTNEKTYIVQVAGNITGTEEEKALAEKNRKQVLSELALKLGADSYEVTDVYDMVYNGFAIKTSEYNADILKKTLNVSEVAQSHTYALPTGEEDHTVTFNADGTTTIKEQKLTNYSAETMHARASDVKDATGVESKGGEGVTIGILDTGLFMNQVEGTSTRTALEKNNTYRNKINAPAFVPLASGIEAKTKDYFAEKTSKSNFTYVNSKIPFAYDFAGNDNDVDPKSDSQNHGTHVASLAAANGEDFQGIAPNAQLAILKVFGDSSGGANDNAIIAAINEAAKLGLDEINMSLGSDLVDTSDSISNTAYQALKGAADLGVIANISAGNSGKSSFSSGNYANYTTDIVEGGILGSYANYDETANIVASSNPDKAFYSSIMQVTKDGSEVANAVSYSDQVITSTTQNFLQDRPLTDLLGYHEVTIDAFAEGTTYYTKKVTGEDDSQVVEYVKVKSSETFDSSKTYYVQDSSVTADYIVVPGYGQSSDYDKLEAEKGEGCVKGKIAVVYRGNSTFVDKYEQAQLHGAIACVVINNTASTTFNFSMDFNSHSPNIPVVFVFQNSKSYWGDAGQTGKVNLKVNSVAIAGDGNSVSSFSSDGPSSNLDIGPSVSAPGSQVIGAVSATASNAITGDATSTGVSGLYGYENMSGTSMAAPNLTGAIALALGQKKASFTGDDADTKFANEKKVISAKAMATADQLVDGVKEAENSPRMQGAGRINVTSLLTADSYVTVPNASTDGYENTTQSKAELKNLGSLYVKDGDFSNAGENYIEFEYTVHNDSDKAKTYQPSMSVMIPKLEITTNHEQYDAEEANSKGEEVGYDSSVSYIKGDKNTYPTFVGTPTMSVRDDTVVNYDSSKMTDSSTLTVPAHGSAKGTAKIRIDNLSFEKTWNDNGYIEDFDGTLKDYISKYFAAAGGTYVEGYLKLEETTTKKDGEYDDDETLTVPYMGFYGDYSVADAVEPFDFEKEDALSYDNGKTIYNPNYRVYNSDLANNFLKGLNAAYAKPKAYAGSALSASSSKLTNDQLNSIGNFNMAPTADGSTLLSVVNIDKTELYAGGNNSAYMHAFFYVNRNISEGTWTIKDSTGKAVTEGKVGTLMGSSGTYYYTEDFGVIKSWLTSSETGYEMNRGFAEIDLSKVAEGKYTLQFDFALNGLKDANGNHVVKSRIYTLNVDRTAPTLDKIETVTNGSNTSLKVTSTGASDSIKVGTNMIAPTLVDGTKDTYTATSKLSNSVLKADKVNITLSDYAHNSIIVMVHPSDLTFSVASTFFTDRHDFTIEEIDPRNNMYEISILDKNGNPIDGTKLGAFKIYVQLATGLSKDEVTVELDSEETKNISYDSTTGVLTINVPKGGVSTITLSVKPAGQGGNESSSTPDSSSSVTPDTSSQPSGDSSSSSSESKKGCGGSVVAASSVVGALALACGALALKKKKEDK